MISSLLRSLPCAPCRQGKRVFAPEQESQIPTTDQPEQKEIHLDRLDWRRQDLLGHWHETVG